MIHTSALPKGRLYMLQILHRPFHIPGPRMVSCLCLLVGGPPETATRCAIIPHTRDAHTAPIGQKHGQSNGHTATRCDQAFCEYKGHVTVSLRVFLMTMSKS